MSVCLLKLGATTLLVLLWPEPLLQTVSCDLEMDFEVGQRGEGTLQLRQEVIRVEGHVGPACCGSFCGSGIRIDVVAHPAPPLFLLMSGSFGAVNHQNLCAVPDR